MPRAICEDCGSLVEAELTHNGVGRVGHYVHCGWGHQLSSDDLISDDVAKIISKLEAKLTKAEEERDGYLAERNKFQLYLQRTHADLELEVAAVEALNAKLTKAVDDTEKWRYAFAAQSRKLQAVLYIEGVKAVLAELGGKE